MTTESSEPQRFADSAPPVSLAFPFDDRELEIIAEFSGLTKEQVSGVTYLTCLALGARYAEVCARHRVKTKAAPFDGSVAP